MPAQTTVLRYGSVAMTLHWLIAALIAVNLCLGFYFANIEAESDPIRFGIIQTHKSIGLTILVLSLLRLAWRLMNPVPPLPSSMSPGLKFVARATHYLFYVLIIAVPLAGWAIVSSSPLGTPTVYFGLFQWPHISFLAELPRAQKKEYVELFEEVHELLAYSAFGLLLLHVAGALWHQYVKHDDVMRRMLPGTEVKGPAA